MANVIIAGNAEMPAVPRGRLIFALDATASRQPTWDTAVELQAAMFQSTAPIGQLSVQLVFYRGDGECRASRWVSSGAELAQSMRKIDCRGGITQIGRILAHVRRETERAPVQAVVFIGDAMEESVDGLAGAAGELGRLGVPVYTFLEGHDRKAEAAFRLIALRSGGQFHRFGAGTPEAIERLATQLSDVALAAVEGALALADGRKR
jgi:hypothetical protein